MIASAGGCPGSEPGPGVGPESGQKLPCARRSATRCGPAGVPLFLAACLVCTLSACATPAQRIDRLAASSGFQRLVVAGAPFDHLVYVKSANPAPQSGELHVYVEGDGTPWITHHLVARDPTPRRPLMLKLMALDPGPALYLGRPCYFGLMRHCASRYWTGARYSETVVHSMIVALDNVRRQLGLHGKIDLLGYSGGGTLAMLLAPRLKETSSVVTIAANLDVRGWTRLHGYSPLADSLDPADEAPLPARIAQIHLVGEEDRNVPPAITRAGVARQRNATIISYPHYNHHCCWERVWRSVLDRL